MTAPDAPASGDTAPDATTETPGYTSPTEQLLQSLPFMGLGQFFERLTRSSGSKGGGFEFSLSEMRELHRQFEDEANELEKMSKKSTHASHGLVPLASDQASVDHYRAAVTHFAKLDQAIEQHLVFAKGFEKAVGKAIGVREESEQATANAAKKAGKAF